MFKGFTPAAIDFMWGIRLNNYRSWFEEHKEEYRRDLLLPMKELGKDVFELLESKCPGRDLIFKVSRLHRDARRIRGGPPYKDHLWFTVERPREERLTSPAFWFELTPEEWSYGLGYYSARSVTMAKLRARLRNDTKRFERLAGSLSGQEEFVLEGPEYARKKEAPSAKTSMWYNRKYFSIIHEEPLSPEIFKPGLAERLADGFEFLMPLYDYFITLDSDPEPED